MKIRICVLGLALLFAALSTTVYAELNNYTSDMYHFPVIDDLGRMVQAPQVIPGATAELKTNPAGAIMSIHAHELRHGDVVTAWWVIFNNPDACSGGVCDEDDVLPFPGNRATGLSLLYADGRIVDPTGGAYFYDALKTGDTAYALFGPGLINPTGAEIHVVLRTHGPAQVTILDEQLHSFDGGCDLPSDPCADIQFAMFQQTPAPEADNVTRIFVSSRLVDCEGVAPQTCMLIKENRDDEWMLWYDAIEGFEYEEGYQYELLVEISHVENPPADASAIKLKLVEVVRRIKI